jgi:uncharacterized protein YfaT (DUF1175 family)
MNDRRDAARLLAMIGIACAAAPAAALNAALRPQLRLTQVQTRAFQSWMVRIVREQVVRGPSPRWHHRDCAGLVRFAVTEALTVHDARWMRANGLRTDRSLPPELDLSPQQASLRNRWNQDDGATGSFVTALSLVQNNSRHIGRDVNLAQAGDLLFFDQGDDQHLMIWMGSSVAYHTGTVTPTDNGLRSIGIRQLLSWKDTRWHPADTNPNFAGVYRLQFLS